MSPLTEPTRIVLAKDFTWNETIWNPSMLDPALWFDAADASTIIQSGGAVSQWNDKSRNGRNVFQGNASQQPIITSNQLNGLPGVIFDGSNDILLNQNAGVLGVENVTMIALLKYITGSGQDIILGLGQTGFPSKARLFYRANGGTTQGFATGSNDISTSATLVDIGGSHHVFGVKQSGQSVFISRDGVEDSVYPRSLPNPPDPVGFDGISIGSLQGALVGNYYSNVSVCEVLCFFSALDTSSMQKTEGYLAHKWGLTANLPAGHPYKTVGPTP